MGGLQTYRLWQDHPSVYAASSFGVRPRTHTPGCHQGLTGYDIRANDKPMEDSQAPPIIQPIGPGGQSRTGDDPQYVREIIDSLNRLFGEATPLRDQASFVNLVVAIAKENHVVVAQVENNTREQALKGNLPGAVQQAVVRALSSHQTLATLVLKSDKQAMSGLIEMIYDLVRNHQTLNLDHLNPQHPTHPTS